MSLLLLLPVRFDPADMSRCLQPPPFLSDPPRSSSASRKYLILVHIANVVQRVHYVYTYLCLLTAYVNVPMHYVLSQDVLLILLFI